MFIENKYTRCYWQIIDRARSEKRSRKDGRYYERHHIHPKSIGGSNDADNLVLLTGREHYICHVLLMKMVESKKHQFQMCAAFLYMSKVRNDHTGKRYNSRLYEYHKKIRTKIQSEKFVGEGNNNYGKMHSKETRAKISAARKGVNTNTPEALEEKRKRFEKMNNDPEMRKKQDAGRSKDFVVTNPEGTSWPIKNLAQFCKENSLSKGNMTMVAKGRYKATKGWKCEYA